MAANKNNNKSMFLYTALIFVVAIILIVLSFFGQANVEKSQPGISATLEPAGQLSETITERAAVLSEENMKLIEENKQLAKENEKLEARLKNSEALSAAANCMALNDKEGARKAAESVNKEILGESELSLMGAVEAFINSEQ